jgi:hypothetical protein
LNEFLTEIVCHDLGIIIDKFVSTKNVIDISSTAIWTFGEECEETGYKQTLTGPMGCGNSVYTDHSFYNFDVINNPELKGIDFKERK